MEEEIKKPVCDGGCFWLTAWLIYPWLKLKLSKDSVPVTAGSVTVAAAPEAISSAQPSYPLPDIAAGDYFLFKPGESDGPFEAKKRKPVLIKEVKHGWVRYDMGAPFNDERRTVESFLRMYRKIV